MSKPRRQARSSKTLYRLTSQRLARNYWMLEQSRSVKPTLMNLQWADRTPIHPSALSKTHGKAKPILRKNWYQADHQAGQPPPLPQGWPWPQLAQTQADQPANQGASAGLSV